VAARPAPAARMRRRGGQSAHPAREGPTVKDALSLLVAQGPRARRRTAPQPDPRRGHGPV